MDSHCKGPRGGNGYGAVLSAIAAAITFGNSAVASKEITRTHGASVANPILVRISGVITTAFDGTSPVFRLVETNLDGSGSAVIANIGDFTSNKFELTKVLEVDKIYKLLYTPATGSPTAGKGHYFIEFAGPGQPNLSLS